MVKDTIRLILFLDCNLHCEYCCNKQEQFNHQFKHIPFGVDLFLSLIGAEINMEQYKNICITGGEPFMKRELLYDVLGEMSIVYPTKNIFLYSNGLLITDDDIELLAALRNDRIATRTTLHPLSINIGLHTLDQLSMINPNLEKRLPVRFSARDIYHEQLLKMYPTRLNEQNLKSWVLNECNAPNEDWVLLEGDHV